MASSINLPGAAALSYPPADPTRQLDDVEWRALAAAEAASGNLTTPVIDSPEVGFEEITTILSDAIVNQPRNLQKRIGPSEIGEPCSRALISKLAGLPEPDEGPNLRAWVGTAIHEKCERIMREFMAILAADPRYLLEQTVSIGTVGGVEITGSADLFDTLSGCVWDWKALEINEPVATPDGWCAIGDLAVGDQVLGSDFKPHDVIGINDFPDRRALFRVEFNDGTYVRATADHLWTVRRRGTLMTIRTDELRTSLRQEDRIEPISAAPGTEAPLPIHPYVLGVWLGDGGCDNKATTVPITLGAKKRAVLERVQQLSGAAEPWQYAESSLQLRPPINAELKLLGLHRCHAPSKFVPPSYLRASRTQRAELLAGLMDTDGGITNSGSVQFYTTSSQLAEQVAELARSLDGWARIWEKATPNYYIKNNQRHYTGTVDHRVTIRMPENPFRCHDERAERWSLLAARQVRRKSRDKIIKTVSRDGEGHARCIAIDTADELFLTRSLTPTHNTKSRTQMKKHKRDGPGAKYRAQFHSYGAGMAALGYRVTHVGAIYIPRDGDFSDIFYQAEPFDPEYAAIVLRRANELDALARLLGPKAAIDAYPKCSNEFCRVCGNYRKIVPGHGREPTADNPFALSI